MVVVKLSSFEPHDIWRDGRYLKRPGFRSGSLSILDLRHAWVTDLQQPFHTVNFFVPQHALDGLAEDLRAPKIGHLTCPLDSEQRDDVMLHLALSLRPALERPWEATRLFADQIAAAMSTHLAFTYGGLTPGAERVKGGLSPVQERRVKEMLMADMRGDVSLSDLASACGLSAGHFSRAFKQTTGLPPHRWLMEQRLKRAKALLLDPSRTLSDVAAACGFADQSHFTRVFSGRVGATPGAWKRLMGG
jgi:AraC-like DNA-binding protein